MKFIFFILCSCLSLIISQSNIPNINDNFEAEVEIIEQHDHTIKMIVK